MGRIITIIFFCLTVQALSAQKTKLAEHYYANGEYEKAADIYLQLLEERYQPRFFERVVDCYLSMEQYQKAESFVGQAQKEHPKDVKLLVTLGNIYDRQLMEDKANAQYQRAIEQLPNEYYVISQLANSFINIAKYDLAAQTYIKGQALLKDDYVFAGKLGDVYQRKGNEPAMIEYYLKSLEKEGKYLDHYQTLFQRHLSPEGMSELTAQLYALIQTKPDIVVYPEMLSWVLIQQKNYPAALRQVIALDKRYKEDGQRVFKLANVAYNELDFDTAIRGFDYVVQNKGVYSTYYIDAQQMALKSRRDKITKNLDYSKEELIELRQRYLNFLDEYGRDKRTAPISIELAELESFYLDNLSEAIKILEEVVAYPGIDPGVQAVAKLKTGDLYLIQGENWESTLLYSQVDKAFKEDMIGHEARLRNAKLSYYTCDFEWAQSQFDVLKASTSKLISNDALDYSIFIMDNLGLDSTEEAMSQFAKADLLIFQKKYEEALAAFDDVLKKFPEHSLQDDVYFKKGEIFTNIKKYEAAAEHFEKVVENHAEDIRADNALYALAKIYEGPLKDIEKAKELYEKIFIEYSASTFAVDARKRFRILRGDFQEPQ